MTDEPKAIRQKLLDLLARREHSQHELQQKLQARGFAETAIGAVMNGLAAAGLQSDNRFAESYLHARAQKGYGPIRISNELNQRGVTIEVIATAMDRANCDWQALAEQVRQKKFGAAIPKDPVASTKQIRFLQYRGFTSDQIRAAVECCD